MNTGKLALQCWTVSELTPGNCEAPWHRRSRSRHSNVIDLAVVISIGRNYDRLCQAMSGYR